jgi:hypothetical protein
MSQIDKKRKEMSVKQQIEKKSKKVEKHEKKTLKNLEKLVPRRPMRSPLSLRVVTRCGSFNSFFVISHTGGETPRIVTLRVAARGLFFLFANAIKSDKH